MGSVVAQHLRGAGTNCQAVNGALRSTESREVSYDATQKIKKLSGLLTVNH